MEGFDFTSTFSFLAIKDSSIGDHVSQPVADVLIWAFSEHCSADNQEDEETLHGQQEDKDKDIGSDLLI